MKIILAVAALLILAGCFDGPQKARDKEQQDDRIQWLERMEIERQTAPNRSD